METASGQNRFALRIAAAAALLAALVVLYQFPPAKYSFYPRCLFHSLTGMNCPGCGSLRALHELLHGNFQNALQLNAGCVLLVPMLGIVAARRWIHVNRRN